MSAAKVKKYNKIRFAVDNKKLWIEDADGKIVYHKAQTVSLFKPSDDDVLAAILLANGN